MIIKCVDCQSDFEFTDEEQAFYKSKGLANTPKRCADCRAKRNASSKDRSQGGNKLPTRSFPATCSRCGIQFNAPFQPKPDRSVFCKQCYLGNKS